MSISRVVPPRPEALLDALIKLQGKVSREPFLALQRARRLTRFHFHDGRANSLNSSRRISETSFPSRTEFRGEITVQVAKAERISGINACALI